MVKRLGWLFIVLGLSLIFVALAGCSNEAPTMPKTAEGTPGYVATFWADSIDGRQIPCVSWNFSYGGGLSCDWSDEHVLLGEGLEDES